MIWLEKRSANAERQKEKIFDGINQFIAIIEKLKEKDDIKIIDILNNLINNNQLFNDAEIGDTILIIKKGFYCEYKKLNS